MGAGDELTETSSAGKAAGSAMRRAAGVALAGAIVVAALSVGQLPGGDGDERPGATAPAGGGADIGGGKAAGKAVPVEPFQRFDGTAVALSDYRGRPLVVNFWASWCPPCVAEMPDFEAVHQRLGDQVAFVGVNLTDTTAGAEALARRTGVTYDLGRDVEGRLFQAMGGFSMPTTFLVSADGRIVEQHTGQLSRRELERLVDEHLTG